LSFRGGAAAEEPAFAGGVVTAGKQKVPLRLRRVGMTSLCGDLEIYLTSDG